MNVKVIQTGIKGGIQWSLSPHKVSKKLDCKCPNASQHKSLLLGFFVLFVFFGFRERTHFPPANFASEWMEHGAFSAIFSEKNTSLVNNAKFIGGKKSN